MLKHYFALSTAPENIARPDTAYFAAAQGFLFTDVNYWEIGRRLDSYTLWDTYFTSPAAADGRDSVPSGLSVVRDHGHDLPLFCNAFNLNDEKFLTAARGAKGVCTHLICDGVGGPILFAEVFDTTNHLTSAQTQWGINQNYTPTTNGWNTTISIGTIVDAGSDLTVDLTIPGGISGPAGWEYEIYMMVMDYHAAETRALENPSFPVIQLLTGFPGPHDNTTYRGIEAVHSQTNPSGIIFPLYKALVTGTYAPSDPVALFIHFVIAYYDSANGTNLVRIDRWGDEIVKTYSVLEGIASADPWGYSLSDRDL
jgi:hypothetical protein